MVSRYISHGQHSAEVQKRQDIYIGRFSAGTSFYFTRDSTRFGMPARALCLETPRYSPPVIFGFIAVITVVKFVHLFGRFVLSTAQETIHRLAHYHP